VQRQLLELVEEMPLHLVPKGQQLQSALQLLLPLRLLQLGQFLHALGRHLQAECASSSSAAQKAA
jgi:hypothetical protein